MEIEVLVATDARRSRVRIAGEHDTPLSEIEEQLGFLGWTPGSLHVDGRPVPSDTPLGDSGIVDGSVLAPRAGAPGPRIGTPAGLELWVTGGRAAGWRFPLTRGVHIVGRQAPADLLLPDPECSGRHAELRCEDGRCTLTDVGSTNGTYVDGTRLPPGEAHPQEPGDRVRIGSTLLEVVRPAVEALPLVRNGHRLGVNPRFRSAAPTFPSRVALPSAPRDSEVPPYNLLLTLAPGAAMAGMALLVGRIEFLLFALMSPLLGIGRTVSQRRRHVRDTEAEHRQYEADVASASAQLEQAVRDERRARSVALPNVAALQVDARVPGRGLWNRQPQDPDFLTVLVGHADVPSAVEVTGAEGAAARPLAQAAVGVSLPAVSNLSITGPKDRVRSVAAGLVLQLAVRESPRNVKLVVVADGDADDAWEWATWLPHCRWEPGDEHRLVGSDRRSTALRLAELNQLIKGREERQRSHHGSELVLPVVVIVLDDASAAVANGFADILTNGPAVGVHAVCLDEHQVPAQCRASVSVAAGRLDESVFDQHGHEPVRELLVDQPEPAVLDEVARSLAALVPLGATTGGVIPSSVRLLDVLGMERPHSDEVLATWRASPAVPAAIVGVGNDGPVSLDLTQHGPHGLVAGTTRAGKSEFIKTFVASLALQNHPDDLSFLFIDFKAAGDYRVLKRFPHAVDLATGEDLADFERTTRLLDAEISRRRRRFDEAGANNIEQYTAARGDDPSLPPVGRLVVIADEFAEMVSTAPQQIERLVSVARTGGAFGIHLLLATQRPAGAVTGQIDANVALRVCFRVAKPEDSDDVIGAPVAAAIAQQHRGRAFFRAHSEPLVELQCARIGGARPGTEQERTDPAASLLVWNELGHPALEVRAREVPDEQTDLWDVADACRDAAAAAGWSQSAVPWPKPLPERVSVAELPVTDNERLVPFAVADDAANQRQRAVGLSLDGGHLAVVGAAGTGRTTALRAVAYSLAERRAADDAHLYVLDFASGGLRPLADLPHCGGTAFGDWEQASRLVKELSDVVRQRLEHFAAKGLSSIEDQRRIDDGPMPYLVLLIDGWEVLADEGARLSLPDEIIQLLAKGQAAGLRAVVAGDRTVSVGRLSRTISERFVLAFHDERDYTAFGLSMRQVPVDAPPGRAVLVGTGELAQIARLSPSGEEVVALRELAARCRRRDEDVQDRWPRRVEPLPEKISLEQLRSLGDAPSGALVLPIGLGGDHRPRYVDLAATKGPFVVAGPSRSGRSTFLRTAATALADTKVALVLPRPSPLGELADLPHVVATLVGEEARTIDPDLLLDAEVVLIDDADMLDDVDAHMDLLADRGRQVILAGEVDSLANGRGWLLVAAQSRTGLVLCPRNRYDGGAVGGARFSDEQVFDAPAGRAVAVSDGRPEIIQTPLV